MQQPTFDENGQLFFTAEDETRFAQKIDAVRLPDDTLARLLTNFILKRWTREQYNFEKAQAKLLYLLEGMIGECDYWIELDEGLNRFENEGGLVCN